MTMGDQADSVLWDVMEEHLEEAGFLWSQWERALVAPDLTLEQAADGDEARLLAHLDALLLGGEAVAGKLLLPELADGEDPELALAAALVLLAGGQLEPLLEALQGAEGERLEALGRALELAPPGVVQPALPSLARAPRVSLRALALRVLASFGLDPGPALLVGLQDPDPGVLQAALAAAPFAAPDEQVSALVLGALSHPEAPVLSAALRSGMLLGLPAAREACAALVAGQDPRAAPAMTLLALCGPGEAQRGLVLGALEAPALAAAALWALGYYGWPSDAELCLERIDEPELGGAAREAFCYISGAVLPAEPAPGEAASWWQEHRQYFVDGQRHVLGHAWGKASLLAALGAASMARRQGLALELSLRTGGRRWLQTRAWSAVQLQQQAVVGAADLPALEPARGWWPVER